MLSSILTEQVTAPIWQVVAYGFVCGFGCLWLDALRRRLKQH